MAQFPSWETEITALPFLEQSSELNIAQGMHIGAARSRCGEGLQPWGAFTVRGSSREPGWRVVLHPPFVVGV